MFCRKCTKQYTHIHTHSRLTVLFPGLPRRAGTRKVKPIWILLKQETVSGSGISWAICKSAPRSRQIATPAPHHSCFFTGRMPFLSPNQQRQSTEGNIVPNSKLHNTAKKLSHKITWYKNIRQNDMVWWIVGYQQAYPQLPSLVWLCDVMVRALDLWLHSCWFNLWPFCFQAATLVKWFAHMPHSPSSTIWYWSKSDDAVQLGR